MIANTDKNLYTFPCTVKVYTFTHENSRIFRNMLMIFALNATMNLAIQVNEVYEQKSVGAIEKKSAYTVA